MQEKIKILTIGDYEDSILKNHFKDNENIEKLNNKIIRYLIVTWYF